jgi:hypothetical protein
VDGGGEVNSKPYFTEIINMRIYVAGPMKSKPLFNFPLFAEATASLRAHGHKVISPAEDCLNEGFDPENPGHISPEQYEAWMQHDFECIDRSDAICLLPGWMESPGAIREHKHACEQNKQILIYEDANREGWWAK